MRCRGNGKQNANYFVCFIPGFGFTPYSSCNTACAFPHNLFEGREGAFGHGVDREQDDGR